MKNAVRSFFVGILACGLLACAAGGSSSSSSGVSGASGQPNVVLLGGGQNGAGGGIAPVVVNDHDTNPNIGGVSYKCADDSNADLDLKLNGVLNGSSTGDFRSRTNPLEIYTGNLHNSVTEVQTQMLLDINSKIGSFTINNPSQFKIRFYVVSLLEAQTANLAPIFNFTGGTHFEVTNQVVTDPTPLIGRYTDVLNVAGVGAVTGFFDYDWSVYNIHHFDQLLVGRICDLSVNHPTRGQISVNSNEFFVIFHEGAGTN